MLAEVDWVAAGKPPVGTAGVVGVVEVPGGLVTGGVVVGGLVVGGFVVGGFVVGGLVVGGVVPGILVSGTHELLSWSNT